MKVAVFSNNSTRFVGDLLDHWRAKGHEVNFEPGSNEFLADKSDVVFVDQFDNNVYYLKERMKNKANVKVFGRALDWDVWIGNLRDQNMIDWVDGVFCIAPHIEKRLRAEANMEGKLHFVRLGVDMNKFTFKKEFGGYNIVMPVNEVDWYLKNTLMGLRIFHQLVRETHTDWKLFIKGHFKEPEYFQLIIKDYIEKSGIKPYVQIDEQWVDDYNVYLEPMDYCLLPSLKEGFSFVTAQCAAKGIKPVLNWWYGAEGLWPKDWLFLDEDEATAKIIQAHDKNPFEYRDYIDKTYNFKRQAEEMDRIMGL
jgi:hypothetical protein